MRDADIDSTKEQLVAEISALRQRIAALEAQVSEQTQSENARSASEVWYQHLAENVVDVLWVRDLQLRPIYISPSVTRLRGYSVEEAMKQPFAETLTPASREAARQALAHAMALEQSGEAPPDRFRTLELELTRKDGSTVWTETCVTFLRDAQGRAVGFVGVNRDLSARKQAEAALERTRESLEARVSAGAAALQRAQTSLAAEITERQQVQAAWRMSEQRYRQLVESSQGLICLHDMAGVMLSINPAAARMLGDAPQALAGQNLRAFLAPSAQPLFDAYLERIQRDGTARGLMRVMTRAGDERVLTYHNQLMEGASEAPYVLGHAQDITERVQAEAALRASEAKFRDLIEGSIQGILIHRDNHILFVNQAYADIFGYASVDALYALDDALSLVAPTDRERLTRYQETRLAGESAPSHYDYQGLRQDGARIWLDMTVRVVSWDGRPATQSIVVDITERRRAEAALRESEDRYRRVVEGSLQGIVIHRDGRLQYVNPACAQMFGYDNPDALLGVNLWETLFAQESWAAIQSRIASLRRGAALAGPMDLPGVRRDGRRIWIASTSSVMRWRGQPAMVSFYTDVTARKEAEAERQRLEAQLRQSQKMEAIGALAAGIAHEFNNTLTAILGFAELTQREMPPASQAWLNLQHVLQAGHRSKDLVQQILDFSHPSERQQKPIRLTPVIQEALKLLRASLPATIEIRQQIAPDVWHGAGRCDAAPSGAHEPLYQRGACPAGNRRSLRGPRRQRGASGGGRRCSS